VPGHSVIGDELTFNIPTFMQIDIFVQGDPTLQFTSLLLNGVSIATNFTLAYGSPVLKGTGFAAAGPVSLKFVGSYTCPNCYGSAYNGYVQVTQATPPPPSGGVPEPATWATMIAGMGAVGASMRRRRTKINFA
jgi:hypothetical protein